MRRRDGQGAAHRLKKLHGVSKVADGGALTRWLDARVHRGTLRIERCETLPACDEFASQRAA